MKNRNFHKLLLPLILSIFIVSCKEQAEGEQMQTPKVQVKTTNIKYGYLPDNIELSGKTIYLSKSNIVAPISGYITKVKVRQGDRVQKGKLLFEIQSPESYVMQQKDSVKSSYGLIKIYAPTSGIISGLNIMHPGVYVDKAAVMTIIIASNNLKVQVQVPFEYHKYTRLGNNCKIILPDSTVIKGTFSKILPKINELSQTEKVLANLNTNTFIPENMIVKILVDKSLQHKSQIIDRNCLLSDALMNNFWVMKLINDSVAVRVPVSIGNQTHEQIELLSPQFTEQDQIINEGAYGLGDTSFVEIVKYK